MHAAAFASSLLLRIYADDVSKTTLQPLTCVLLPSYYVNRRRDS